ncbi:MAG: VanZ family protein [Chitinophagaceae bacterium]|nr:VanZ family protein [Chitinophagaceae bacterium]
MLVLIQRVLSKKAWPLTWTLLIIILLCLPGSYVPGDGLFGIKNFDKVVHVFLFGFNVVFWSFYYRYKLGPGKEARKMIFVITALTIILGIAMEFVQLYFIPNRSFDNGDIIADIAGAVIVAVWLIKI